MSKTLADHIFQDRILLKFPKSEILQSTTSERLLKTYRYDNLGYAKYEYAGYFDQGTFYFAHHLECTHHITHDVAFTSGWATEAYFQDPVIISTKINKEGKLGFYVGNYEAFTIEKSKLDSCFGNIYIKEEDIPVCPECGGELDEEGNCKNPNCGESEEGKTPSNPNDNPPVILGYADNDIWDIEGYVGYSIPVFFRAYDDIGISKFSYCELDEHETEGIQIIRYFKPQKVGDISYRLNLTKELEGTYRYKITVYDTAGQKAESNTFSVVVKPAITPPSKPPTPPSVSDSEHIILYDKKANEFESNGIGIIDNDVIECTVEKEENGVFELTLKYLVSGRYADKLLDTENVIKCKTDISDNIAQLFRIYNSEYVMQDNVIIVKAQHISYDLKDCFVENVNLVDVTCKQATQTLITRAIGNDKFVVNSDITQKANFSKQRINVLEGIMGIEDSILDTYSNSNPIIDRNNFYYNINGYSENNKGIVIAYSKNLIGFRRSIDINNIITGIYPYTYLRNGACLNLKEKVIYSKYKDNYATCKIKPIEFTSENIVNEETLREEASKYFDNGCDLPKINYEVNFVSLYANNYSLKDKFKSLEEVVLGDTVTVQDSKIGLNVNARVIKTTYNVLTKRYEKIELGNFKNEYRASKKNERNSFKRIVRNIIN